MPAWKLLLSNKISNKVVDVTILDSRPQVFQPGPVGPPERVPFMAQLHGLKNRLARTILLLAGVAVH